MKLLKIIGGLLLTVIALCLIAAYFLPKDFGALEKVTINRPINEVYDFAKYLKNQGEYSKWQMMDPNMEHYYEGEDGTVGFVSGWKSENPEVGNGEQEITAIDPGKRIDYELRFLEPFESKATAYMTFESTGANQTEVGWGFSGNMAYPMNLMIPMMKMETAIANDFQTGLQNLKGLLEQ